MPAQPVPAPDPNTLTLEVLEAGGAPSAVKPGFHTHVWPWLKGPAQRFILPTWNAMTIFSHIFSWKELDEYTLAHELCHVRQWKAHGIMYIPRYLGASRAAAAAGKDRYWDNAFEAEAYGLENALRTMKPPGVHP